MTFEPTDTEREQIKKALWGQPLHIKTADTIIIPMKAPTPPPVDLMIDIETMGNTPGAAILSIGAVFIKDGKLAEEFYQHIDLQSCLENGLKMDAGTVQWWMKQTDEARDAITRETGANIFAVLADFFSWVSEFAQGAEVQVWGNAATFDVVLMEEAFRRVGYGIPWKFWGHRCYRTLKSLFPNVTKPEFTGIKHHALDDAKWQALHLINILNHINCLQNVFDSATNSPQTHEQENPAIQSPGFVAANPQDTGPDGADGVPGFYDTSEDPAAGVSGTP